MDDASKLSVKALQGSNQCQSWISRRVVVDFVKIRSSRFRSASQLTWWSCRSQRFVEKWGVKIVLLLD